jgi:N-acetylglutamate synthase
MTVQYRTMELSDFDQVLTLWKASEGIGLGMDDTLEGINRYLKRNPEMSFVAMNGDQLVGAALCGHDGRRGYLHHLAVHPNYRRKGTGKELAKMCLEALQRAGISKCNIFVYIDNLNAIRFWEETGWEQRKRLILMSKEISAYDL